MGGVGKPGEHFLSGGSCAGRCARLRHHSTATTLRRLSRRTVNRTVSLLLWLAAACILTAPARGAEAPLHFDRDIRPILSEHCFACHGPDGGKRKANLRLDTREGLFGKSKSGAPLVSAGRPRESVLLKRITTGDPDEVMPPPATGKQLSTAQRTLLRRWVEEGAPWSPGWAWTAPVLPAIPTVKQSAWPRGDLDRFVLAALEQRGWRPAPEADRITLLRRVSYDLIGLPPTPAEVDAFLADSSPQAYERVVDRLLASKHFGERMAQHWLDLARYADSDGYHDDFTREMHGYRDYVIAAFNRNLPFDKFTIEQLAGDLLPNPTREQLVATAFNRNGPTTSENGADAEEYRARYAAERVNTTATVWLGLSLACAECHDHKYDPLTTLDYYRMFAFFNQVPGHPLANGGAAEPILRLVPPGAHDRLMAAEAELKNAQAALRKLYYEPHPSWDKVQSLWEQRMRETKLEPVRLRAWRTAPPMSGDTSTDDGPAVARRLKWTPLPDGGTNEVRLPALAGARFVQCEVTASAPCVVRCHVSTNATARVWLDDRLMHVTGRDAEWPGRARFFSVRVPAGRHRLLFRVDSSGPGEVVCGADELAAHRVRVEDYQTKKTLEIPPAKRATNELFAVRRTFRELHVPEIDAAQVLVEEAVARHAVAARGSSQIRIMADSTNAVATHILLRGDYRRKGERVTAAVPEALGKLPADAKADRLALARWLMARENPLTARVTVNRFWQMIFGTGLVKTSEDFGAQGEPPSHPELLDWLAVRFRDGGWDVKAALREIVTSATYRQASANAERGMRNAESGPTAAIPHSAFRTPHSEDPENRFLARGPRFRLPAEFIRDTALAASGLLDRTRAPEGRSVLPYQPGPDLWREFAFGESLKYIQDHDGELYRRGVYLFWKRSVLHPYLAVMDAPTRDTCTARRPVTNTPTQALALLNETLLVECARVLGQRVLSSEAGDDAARVRLAFRLVLARQPTEAETRTLLALHADALRHYQADPGAAQKLVSVGESVRPAQIDTVQLAAWLCVGNALLNLDETLTKE
jgi:mono/diheme cytochrome c family protein